MSLPTHPGNTVRHALWLGGLLVILGGLFGMHGLDNHGGAVMGPAGHAAMAAPAPAGGSGHAAMTGAVHAAATVAAVVMLDASRHSGMTMGAADMCMAILVLTLVALILRLYASRVRPLLWLVARSVRAPLIRGRDPDPPSLVCLSILRC